MNLKGATFRKKTNATSDFLAKKLRYFINASEVGIQAEKVYRVHYIFPYNLRLTELYRKIIMCNKSY